jgi:hypothetical protein
VKRFMIVLAKDDGGVELHLMKPWLREHPDQIPPGLDATKSTSHRLRDGLRKLHWTAQELGDEVRLIKPGDEGRIDVLLGNGDEEEEPEEVAELTFDLEHQLRDFLVKNLSSIPVRGKRLRLYVDADDRNGKEYQTGVGPIDILAVDDAEAFYVFELKRGYTPDRTIGQLARYMGWVKQTIGKGHEVFGFIVGKTIDERLRYAVSVIPNVSLLEYEVQFQLRTVNAIGAKTTP